MRVNKGTIKMNEELNEIILKAESELNDKQLRKEVFDYLSKLETRIQTINERTKYHTVRIKELEKAQNRHITQPLNKPKGKKE